MNIPVFRAQVHIFKPLWIILLTVSWFESSKARGVNVIRISTHPLPHVIQDHHPELGFRHGGQNNQVHDALRDFRGGTGRGNNIRQLFQQGGGNRLFSEDGRTFGRHDLEELLQSGHLSSILTSGGGSARNVGDLRDLIQMRVRGRGSGFNSGDLQQLLLNGRGSFGGGGSGGQGTNFGGGFSGFSGNSRGGPGKLTQLILDKGRFFGLGTRILVSHGRLFSDLFGHVIHGVNNFTERVIGSGGDFNFGGSGGSTSNGGLSGLGNLLTGNHASNGPGHGSFVNLIDISGYRHPYGHAGHLHNDHHQRYQYGHNGIGHPHLNEHGHNYGVGHPHLDNHGHNSQGDRHPHLYTEREFPAVEHEDDDPSLEQIHANLSDNPTIEDHGKEDMDQNELAHAAGSHQINEGTSLFRVLRIPPFIPMPYE